MSLEETALQIFCATLADDVKLDLYPNFGEKQIKTCFLLAETFEQVAAERRVKARDKRAYKAKEQQNEKG